MNVPNDEAQRLLDNVPRPDVLDKALHERGLTLTGEAWRIVGDLTQLARGVDRDLVGILSRTVVKA